MDYCTTQRTVNLLMSNQARGLQLSHIGGMRYGFIFTNWTWPLVRLTVDIGAIVFGPSARILGPIVPKRRIPLRELTQITAVGRTFMAQGIQFDSDDGGWTIFWTFHRDQIFNELEQLGLTTLIHRDPIKFKYFST